MEKVEQRCLIALETVLSSRYPDYRYSFNGYKEECACLEKKSDSWEVFIGERGNKEHRVICKSVGEACVEMIKVIGTRTNTKEMLDEFFLVLSASNPASPEPKHKVAVA